jgi:hypothetical protein
VLGSPEKDNDGMANIEDICLRQLENTMLNSVSPRVVKGIKRVPHSKILSILQKMEAFEWKKAKSGCGWRQPRDGQVY